MHARNQINEQQDRRELSAKSPKPAKLDERYGKIGIPAVAAAVRCRSRRERKPNSLRFVPQDCD